MRRAKIQEAKAWEPTNSDGSPNRGSFEYQAVVGLVELAHDLLVERSPGELPSIGKVKSLASVLLRVADAAQAAIRSDQRSDRMDNSHTRARGAVRSALNAFPPPIGGTDEERRTWEQQLTERAVALLTLAAELCDTPAD
jgi:hypothetical protein